MEKLPKELTELSESSEILLKRLGIFNNDNNFEDPSPSTFKTCLELLDFCLAEVRCNPLELEILSLLISKKESDLSYLKKLLHRGLFCNELLQFIATEPVARSVVIDYEFDIINFAFKFSSKHRIEQVGYLVKASQLVYDHAVDDGDAIRDFKWFLEDHVKKLGLPKSGIIYERRDLFVDDLRQNLEMLGYEIIDVY